MDPAPAASQASAFLGDMGDVIKEFLVECNEALDRFDQDLIALEKNVTSRELLDSVFRAIHTIKGTAGVLGYDKLVSVSHLGESVLSRMRDGVLLLSPAITTALLAMADALRHILEEIASSGGEGDEGYCGVVQQLSAVLNQKPHGGSEKAQTAVSEPPTERETAPRLGEILVTTEACQAEDVQTAISRQREGDPRLLGEILVADRGADPGEVSKGLKVQSECRDAMSNTIRVDVALLDKVMNLVGELVLARNQVLQFTGTQEDSSFLSTAQRLNLITTELQEGVMKTRMQPIGNVWNRLPRVVRDMAVGCGKQIEIRMEGAETELDKTIIEAIKDPLTHIIRNAVDHGIECPEARAASGKTREGHLVLRAFHEGGQVNIEVSDDGAGIATEKLKAKAIAKGIVTPDHALRMSERELLNLAFSPGLSTVEKVSNISGRGVGMDVVKTNIEKIGGTVDLQSAAGKGTLLKIKIPLTLAIIPALIVTSGGERFAIPQVSLIELVRCEGGECGGSVENIHGASVYRLRGNLLPLVYLNRELRLGSESGSGSVNIVVLQANDRQFGLVVDEINDTEEIVVKPLSKQLKSVSCFAGATIMGDGRVALILDVLGLAQMTRVVSELHESSVAKNQAHSADNSGGRESWLLFRIGKQGRMAIPLSLVSRLEEFPAAQVERYAGREVMQYREQIMPLVRLAEALGYGGATDSELLQVIVYSASGRSVGLVVDEILDIAEQSAVAQQIRHVDTLAGAAVIQQRVTDLLDVPALLAAEHLVDNEGARA
ncbi:MAG: chemotaxis protein CheW [Candidatus Korobacteraceae bacterium]